jgi:hypothetical protein
MTYFYDTDNGYVTLTDSEWHNVFTILEGFEHRCPDLTSDIISMTMNDLIGDGTACILIITTGDLSDPSRGIYNTT